MQIPTASQSLHEDQTDPVLDPGTAPLCMVRATKVAQVGELPRLVTGASNKRQVAPSNPCISGRREAWMRHAQIAVSRSPLKQMPTFRDLRFQPRL